MEAIKEIGVRGVSYLHSSWVSWYALPLHRSLWYSSPPFILTVLAPLLLSVQGTTIGKVSFKSTLGLSVLWTAIFCLRVNTLKQWALGEDRPFWWVKETNLFSQKRAPDLIQFPVTCLSSPSSPTHTLLAAGVGLVLVGAVVALIRSLRLRKKTRAAVLVAWIGYIAVTSSAALADCFFSQHFPHQVAVAALIGISVAVFILHSDTARSVSVLRTLLLNSLLLGITLAVMYKKDIGSFNEFQKNAFRWCERREWMQIDPTPLMDAFVYTGFAVGTSIATASSFFKKINKSRFSIKMVVSLCILNIGVVQAVLMIPDGVATFTNNIYAIYAVQLVTSALIPFFSVALMPYFVQAASGIQSVSISKHKKK